MVPKSCQKVVKKLPKRCQKVVTKNCQKLDFFLKTKIQKGQEEEQKKEQELYSSVTSCDKARRGKKISKNCGQIGMVCLEEAYFGLTGMASNRGNRFWTD
jgi:hypothetical protein